MLHALIPGEMAVRPGMQPKKNNEKKNNNNKKRKKVEEEEKEQQVEEQQHRRVSFTPYTSLSCSTHPTAIWKRRTAPSRPGGLSAPRPSDRRTFLLRPRRQCWKCPKCWKCRGAVLISVPFLETARRNGMWSHPTRSPRPETPPCRTRPDRTPGWGV